MNVYIKDSIDVRLPSSLKVTDKNRKSTNYEINDSISDLNFNSKFLEITVDATHCGYFNRNGYYYNMSGMAESATSFLEPYQKPVLVEHDDGSKPVGRATAAAFVSIPKGTYALDSEEARVKGRPSGKIRVKAIITDEQAIKDILESRFMTVSIGGRPHGAPKCSVCDSPVGMSCFGPALSCDHELGDVDEKKGYVGIVVDGMDYSEFSFVNHPADYSTDHAAQVVSMSLVDSNGFDKDNQYDSIEFGEEFIYDGQIIKKEATVKEVDKKENIDDSQVTDEPKEEITEEPKSDDTEVSEDEKSDESSDENQKPTEEESKDSTEEEIKDTDEDPEKSEEESKEEPEEKVDEVAEAKTDAEPEAEADPEAEVKADDDPEAEPEKEEEESKDDEPESEVEEAEASDNDVLSALQKKYEEFQSTVEETEDKMKSLQKQLSDKEAQLSAADAKIIAMTEQLKDAMTEKLIDASLIAQQSLVRDLMNTDNKEQFTVEYDKLKAELSDRSMDSIRNSVQDVNKEVGKIQISEIVSDPTLDTPVEESAVSDPFKAIIEDKRKNKKDKTDVVSRLFNNGYIVKEEK